MCQWQHCPVLSQDVTPSDLRTGQNISQAPLAFDRIDTCAIQVFNQLINQKIMDKPGKTTLQDGQASETV
jgi:hypothetical protein